MSNPSNLDLITTDQVLKLFPKNARPSPSTLLNWSRRGYFPAFFAIYPRKFRWSRQAAIDWLVCRGILPEEIASKGE